VQASSGDIFADALAAPMDVVSIDADVNSLLLSEVVVVDDAIILVTFCDRNKSSATSERDIMRLIVFYHFRSVRLARAFQMMPMGWD